MISLMSSSSSSSSSLLMISSTWSWSASPASPFVSGSLPQRSDPVWEQLGAGSTSGAFDQPWFEDQASGVSVLFGSWTAWGGATC